MFSTVDKVSDRSGGMKGWAMDEVGVRGQRAERS